MLKRPVLSKEASVLATDLTEDDIFGDLPALREYLTERFYEDGTVRQTASLLVFCEDGLCKLMVNDREVGRVAFWSGESFTAVLAAAEAALAGDRADWRVSKQTAGRGRQGK